MLCALRPRRRAERRVDRPFSVVARRLWHEVREGTFDALVLDGYTSAATPAVAAAYAWVWRVGIWKLLTRGLKLEMSLFLLIRIVSLVQRVGAKPGLIP